MVIFSLPVSEDSTKDDALRNIKLYQGLLFCDAEQPLAKWVLFSLQLHVVFVLCFVNNPCKAQAPQ